MAKRDIKLTIYNPDPTNSVQVQQHHNLMQELAKISAARFIKYEESIIFIEYDQSRQTEERVWQYIRHQYPDVGMFFEIE